MGYSILARVFISNKRRRFGKLKVTLLLNHLFLVLVLDGALAAPTSLPLHTLPLRCNLLHMHHFHTTPLCRSSLCTTPLYQALIMLTLAPALQSIECQLQSYSVGAPVILSGFFLVLFISTFCGKCKLFSGCGVDYDNRTSIRG